MKHHFIGNNFFFIENSLSKSLLSSEMIYSPDLNSNSIISTETPNSKISYNENNVCLNIAKYSNQFLNIMFANWIVAFIKIFKK